MEETTIKNHAEFIQLAADFLRGNYKQSEHGTGGHPTRRTLRAVL